VTPDLSLETQLDLALRLTVGLVLGAIIGFERELQRQPAGFRTHSLVALGAALFTVVSAFGFAGDLVDPTRVAAQIVSGIGFIGAGAILQYRGNIRGLTTAASLWSVAAIGMAAGSGLYSVAVVGTVLILVVLSILDRVEALTHRRLRIPPKEVPRRRKDDPLDDGMSEDLLP
jgi:putative Mg2+ transporter-C (MgtC) family protein